MRFYHVTALNFRVLIAWTTSVSFPVSPLQDAHHTMAPASRGRPVANRSISQGNGSPAAHDFDLPPSTMAAQLINNLSTSNKPLPPSEQEDLKKLMDEVSNQEASIADFSSEEAKLEHKHKLIYVFARAVLQRLAEDDPFLDFQKIVPQASDALEIFIATIKEMPEVLTYCIGPESTLSSRGQEPLWFWLFPRVLALLARRECESLTDKIKNFFQVCYQAVAQSPILWNLSSFFFSYFKECATSRYRNKIFTNISSLDLAMLKHLQNPTIIFGNHTIDVRLPMNDADQSMFSLESNDSLPSTFRNCSYLVRFASEGLCHLANILCMLVDISMTAVASFDPTPAYQDYLAWLLDSFLASHEQRKRLHADLSLYESCRKADIMSFCSLQTLLSSSRKSLRESSLRKGCTVLSILCADLMENVENLTEHSIELSVCKCLLNLVALCQEQESMHRAVLSHILPPIQSFLNDHSSSFSLLKVALYPATFHMESANSAPEICSSLTSGVQSRGSKTP
jgi:serine/threonine-protein kinase ATR